MLTLIALVTLPTERGNDLEKCLTLLDLTRFYKILEKIRTHNFIFADALTLGIIHFQYRTNLSLILKERLPK